MSTTDSFIGALSRTRAHASTGRSPGLRFSERLLLGYFLYMLVLAALHRGPATSLKLLAGSALAVTGAIFLSGWADRHYGGIFFSIARDWLPAPLVLIAYWATDWLPRPLPHTARQESWIVWDRILRDQWGLRMLLEYSGSVLPMILEFCYSLLYAVPPFSIAILYLCRRRVRVDSFLFLFLAGVLLAYALLPHFPLQGPRTAFAGQDLPNFTSAFRDMNMWLLDRFDIHTSVFPSGHVAVGFSAAFAMLIVLPEKKWIGLLMLMLAVVVLVATVYGRYHYAVDGVAAAITSAGGVAISTLCCSRRT